MSLPSENKMDPVNSFLGRLLLEELTPVVMVLSTPLAEDACQKNGLNFVEMLLPFSLFNKIDVPVRTASDQPYRLQMFKLRLVYASDICQQNYEVDVVTNSTLALALVADTLTSDIQAAEEHLKKVVCDTSENTLPDLLSDPPQLETILNKSVSHLCPSWIQTFNKELIRTLSFSEHETFDHPVACLLVVSSKDEQPVNRFVDLFNTDRLPALLNDGAMDPKILKHYLLLHDNQDGTPENSVAYFHSHQKTSASLSHEIARFLDVDDLNGIRDFMLDLASNHIIPHMEQKIRILNQQVSATRKGFRNQIKNLWWRKGKEEMPEAPNGPTYTFSSTESQIRVLGDYAFMLRDYELALSNFRLLSTDYKLDKAWKHYAGVQKMGSSGQRNATRCGLWWAEMLKARGQYKEAASVYFRISNEVPSLHAAVMLEQASYGYLLSSPPLLRKYGFHLILAGNCYYISEQRQHAIRAYRNTLCVYKGNAWTYITNHVHFNIGRWYAFLGMFDVAIKHMLEVLACSHQSLATQTIFLNDFFRVVQSMGKIFEVYKLQLPVINMASLKVFYEDTRTYASSADGAPSDDNANANALVKKVKEAIKLDLEFKNPLQISISVSGVSLICELSADSGATNFDNSVSETALHEDAEFRKPPSCRDPSDDSSLMLSKFDFVLKGGETKKIQLKVTPRVEGILKIVGVSWTLSDSVVGYRYFEFDTKKNKKGRKGARHSLQRNLNFIVIKGLPKLEGCIHHLPKKTFTGDLRLLMLELRNQSEYSVKSMKMKISHARFLIPGSSADLNLDFPRCLEKRISSASNDVPGNIMEKSRSLLFSFPNDASIQGGTTFMWPLWFHAGLRGSISFYVSVYYEMENSSDMTYRTLRMHYNLEVLPSLDVSFLITPCPSRLQEFLVHMDIMNRTSSETFCLNQLSCVDDRWEISTLPAYVPICPTQTLSAGQALSCFFKLKDCRRTNKERNLSVQGSDVPLGPQGSNKVLIDISRSPLVDFHFHERYHQGKMVQGSPSIVDFILISSILGGSNGFLAFLFSSITSKSPIWWLMDGPRMINHDFATSFCEVSVCVTIRNCSETSASIRLATFDILPAADQISDVFQPSDPSGNQGGWHDASLVDEIKVISDVQASHPRKPSSESISPYVWCGASSTQLKLEPACTAEVPLRICVFTPGTCDLSNYELHWKLQPSEEGLGDDVKRWSSADGLPFGASAASVFQPEDSFGPHERFTPNLEEYVCPILSNDNLASTAFDLKLGNYI
ncbi:trafficking protein particle complex subunit 8 [Cocos nucifera]|uniref:Trafficking protein particle complex subunit 8 n=1 Tax=Cocos nucifera TaxID=13894 RepID=A0A8K0ID36_COCNU|nr:trafficking protein particle complex subunit 8 [Cocos nucifera]